MNTRLLPLSLFAFSLPLAAQEAAAPRFAWADLDLDLRPDAVTVTPEGRLSLLGHGPDGTFQDLLPHLGLEAPEGVTFVLAEDFDRDGDTDLFLGTTEGPSRLLRNASGMGFDDVTANLGLDHAGRDAEARWLDVDLDGDLDLQVIGRGYHRLYKAGAQGFEALELPPVHAGDAATVVVLPAATPEAAPAADSDADAAPGAASRPVRRLGVGREPLAATPDAGGAAVPAPSGDRITASPNCVLSLVDMANAGGCLQASSDPDLGKLYPLSENFFVDAVSEHIGMGTLFPDRKLSVVDGVANEGLATFDNPDPAGFAGVYFEENSGFRGWVGHVNSASFFGGPGTMQLGSGNGDIVFSVTDTGFFEERMRIDTDGNVGIGVADPTARLHMNGMARMGSETGTSQPPNTAFPYGGTLTRRIVSTSTAAGDVVARTNFMRLERDGTAGGLQISYDAGALANQAAYGTALTSGGTVIPIVLNLGAPVTAGTVPVFAATDVVRLDLAFGNVFNTREMTEVTLIRDSGDTWWVGHLTSTFDQ